MRSTGAHIALWARGRGKLPRIGAVLMGGSNPAALVAPYGERTT